MACPLPGVNILPQNVMIICRSSVQILTFLSMFWQNIHHCPCHSFCKDPILTRQVLDTWQHTNSSEADRGERIISSISGGISHRLGGGGGSEMTWVSSSPVCWKLSFIIPSSSILDSCSNFKYLLFKNFGWYLFSSKGSLHLKTSTSKVVRV